MPERPSLRATWSNFAHYDAPLRERVRLFIANNRRKVALRENCCGNLGEPGC